MMHIDRQLVLLLTIGALAAACTGKVAPILGAQTTSSTTASASSSSGAGGGGHGGASATSSTTSSTSSTAASGSGGGDAGCAGGPNASTCTKCMVSKCCAQITACENDLNACTMALYDYRLCVEAGKAFSPCASDFQSNGGPKASALIGCLMVECGGLPNSPCQQ